MQTINIHEAKTHFSKLVDAAISGEEIIIAKAGKPVVKLTPISKNKVRRFGVLKGKIKIANDFDAPLPDDILSSFEGN
ncbi:MAG: type II toxin-antitoxin system Phd/YefM family antitoxin [Pseudomonadota bacterium]